MNYIDISTHKYKDRDKPLLSLNILIIFKSGIFDKPRCTFVYTFDIPPRKSFPSIRHFLLISNALAICGNINCKNNELTPLYLLNVDLITKINRK